MSEKKTAGVRIIGGEWRSRRLPVADLPGLRPTADRVRETLFNWLSPYIVGSHCLDLFAGTGALGFEALSRGAADVVMLEQDRKAAAALQHNADLLKTDKARIYQQNTLNWLGSFQDQKLSRKFDIIFLDPPFSENLYAECLEKLIGADCLQEDALIYVEQPTNVDIDQPENLQRYKESKTGQVKFSLFKAGPQISQ